MENLGAMADSRYTGFREITDCDVLELHCSWELVRKDIELSTTDNSLYTHTGYNDKICYNDNLTVTKPSPKR